MRFLLALFLGAAHAATTPHLPGERLIRIGLVVGARSVSFLPEGDYQVTARDGTRHRLEPNAVYTVFSNGSGLSLGGVELPPQVRLMPVKARATIKIGHRHYHGTLIFRRDGARVTAIEELGIEEYLLGVLPEEMDPDWPLEALKAQAVVARTFAYTEFGKYRKEGFDLTDDTRSQVYHGVTPKQPKVREAVDETRGEVLGYKGRILQVYYHACCGGHTADAGVVWPSPYPTPPPLRGVRDYYCRASPFYRWSAFFSTRDILAALEGHHLVGGTLKRFAVGRKSTLGLVRDFVATIGRETIRVKANDLRLALGATEMKSARILRIRRVNGGIEFDGSGSGHGVGLCQWGARIQAERGRGYERILKFYFPGSTLSVIDE